MENGLSVRLDEREQERVHFGTGFKIGEITPDSAIVWTQLTERSSPVPIRHERGPGPYRKPIDFDSGKPTRKMEGATVPTSGWIRLSLTAPEDSRTLPWRETDGPVKVTLESLSPDTHYNLLIEGRKRPGGPISRTGGSFRTAPRPETSAEVSFAVVSDQYFWDYDDPERGFLVYDAMAALDPDFLVFSGDYIYYDKPGPWTHDLETARHKWNAMHAWPALKDFYARVPVYMQKDDHDTLRDDVHPGSDPLLRFSYEDAIPLWYEQTPVTRPPYRTFRWGRHLQIWLLEGREFRSRNDLPDGPGKTILGDDQKAWLVRTVTNSDASFKLLFSPSAIVGPDRDNKSDNHANAAFQTEGRWLRQFLAENGMIVVIGDRHWQYVSEDPETGLLEFNKGPASASHAAGWNPQDQRPQHHFLRIGAGFLHGSVSPHDPTPTLRLQIRDTTGNVLYEWGQP